MIAFMAQQLELVDRIELVKSKLLNCGSYYTLKPILRRELDLLFVGINPHPEGIQKARFFSTNASFWWQLFEAGITPRKINSDELLEYNFGITNLVFRPTLSSSELQSEEIQKGAQRLREEIEKYEPRILCSIGKLPAQAILKVDRINYSWYRGETPFNHNLKVFVMMFPTFRASKQRKLAILKELKTYLQSLFGVEVDPHMPPNHAGNGLDYEEIFNS